MLEGVDVDEADDRVLPLVGGGEPQRRAHRGPDAGGEDRVLALEARVVEDVGDEERHSLLDGPAGDGAADPREGVALPARRGLDDRLGGGALEEEDRAALRRDGLKEQVEDEDEQLVERPVHHELRGRLAQDGQDPVLPLQVRRVYGRPGGDVAELADGEDAGSFRLGLLLLLLPGVGAEGEGVLAQGDDVAGSQATPLLQGLPVQQGPVLAAQVVDEVALRTLLDRGVVTRQPLVREKDVGVPRAPDGHSGPGEREALLGSTSGLDGNLGHVQLGVPGILHPPPVSGGRPGVSPGLRRPLAPPHSRGALRADGRRNAPGPASGSGR